jgi:mRNA interferase RelE/StbE
MVRYQLELSPIAKAQFANFDETLRLRIVDKIRHFLENNIKPEALEGNFVSSYKLRVGDYRVIYVIENEKIMFVRRIGHRSTVYRDLARD